MNSQGDKSGVDASLQIMPLFFEYTGVHSGEIRLFEHQKIFREAKNNFVVLDAPTGSGKTLAALETLKKSGEDGIFIYPTNQLIEDQANAIKELLVRTGTPAEEILILDGNKPEKTRNSTETFTEMYSYAILVAHGDSLNAMVVQKKRAKGTIIHDFLNKLTVSTKILLTNVDTLYLIAKARYHLSPRILERLTTFNVIVIDELHYYAGVALANLLYILKFLLSLVAKSEEGKKKRVIFLGATHNETVYLVRESFPDTLVRSAQGKNLVANSELEKKGRFVRRKTILDLKTQQEVLWTEEDLQKVCEDVLACVPSEQEVENCPVVLLIIVNSVDFARRLHRRLKESVPPFYKNRLHAIHGFVPKTERKTLQEMDRAILVGTSAIELGIDFDVPNLIFEANDSAAFIQRLGRGGRHRECKALAYVPSEVIYNLRKLKNRTVQMISYDQIVNIVRKSLGNLSSYADFVISPQALRLIAALARSVSKNEEDAEEIFKLFNYLLESVKDLKYQSKTMKDHICKLNDLDLKSLLHRRVTKAIERAGGARGQMNQVLCHDPETGYIFEANIMELTKYHVETRKLQEFNHDSIAPSLRSRYDPEDYVFCLKERRRGGTIKIETQNTQIGDPQVIRLDNFKVIGTALSPRIVKGLADRNIFVKTGVPRPRHRDWRITSFKTIEDDEVVIGGWALVVEHLIEQGLWR